MGVVSEIIGGPESRFFAWAGINSNQIRTSQNDPRHPLFYRNRDISCPNTYLMSMERTAEVFGGGYKCWDLPPVCCVTIKGVVAI